MCLAWLTAGNAERDDVLTLHAVQLSLWTLSAAEGACRSGLLLLFRSAWQSQTCIAQHALGPPPKGGCQKGQLFWAEPLCYPSSVRGTSLKRFQACQCSRPLPEQCLDLIIEGRSIRNAAAERRGHCSCCTIDSTHQHSAACLPKSICPHAHKARLQPLKAQLQHTSPRSRGTY